MIAYQLYLFIPVDCHSRFFEYWYDLVSRNPYYDRSFIYQLLGFRLCMFIWAIKNYPKPAGMVRDRIAFKDETLFRVSYHFFDCPGMFLVLAARSYVYLFAGSMLLEVRLVSQ